MHDLRSITQAIARRKSYNPREERVANKDRQVKAGNHSFKLLATPKRIARDVGAIGAIVAISIARERDWSIDGPEGVKGTEERIAGRWRRLELIASAPAYGCHVG